MHVLLGTYYWAFKFMSVFCQIFKYFEICRKLGLNHLPYKKLQKNNIATASNKYKADCNRRAHVGRLIDVTWRRIFTEQIRDPIAAYSPLTGRFSFWGVLSRKLRFFAWTRLTQFHSSSPCSLMGVVVHKQLTIVYERMSEINNPFQLKQLFGLFFNHIIYLVSRLF